MATTLLSPGVQVTVSDQSNYVSGGPGTIPLIVMATAQDKTSSTGGLAAYTTKATANAVQLISSQRELLNNYGIPNFPSDSSGNRILGSELSEYGLMAAHSVLGLTNSAYCLRADVDLTQLEGSSSRPYGEVEDTTLWQNTSTTEYGIYEWNSVTQDFSHVTPSIITHDNYQNALMSLASTAPSSNYGAIGDYAVVATDVKNPVYVKSYLNVWNQVGSADWQNSVPAVSGLNYVNDSSGGLQPGDSVIINGVTVGPLSVAPTLADLVNAINGSFIVGVAAASVNHRLWLFADNSAESGLRIDIATGTIMADGKILLQNGSGTIWKVCGISVDDISGTEYNNPSFVAQPHFNVPSWKQGDAGIQAVATATLGKGNPTNVQTINVVNGGSGYDKVPGVDIGIMFASGLAVKLNDDITFGGFHYTVIQAGLLDVSGPTPITGPIASGTAVLQLAGLAASGIAVLTNDKLTSIVITNGGTGYTSIPTVTIDAPAGNTARPSGSVWLKTSQVNGGVKFNISEYNASLMKFETKTVNVFAHGDQYALFGLDKLQGGLNIPAGTLYAKVNFAPIGNDLLNYMVMERLNNGPTVGTGTTLNPVFAGNDQFSIWATIPGSDQYSQGATITMILPTVGQTGAQMFVQQLMAANLPYVTASVNSIGQIEIVHLNGGNILMDNVSGTPLTTAGFTSSANNIYDSEQYPGYVEISNWGLATPMYQQAYEPVNDPADGTLWYYNQPLELDIMINEGSKWQGYQNVKKDARGYDLSRTDPNGVIFGGSMPMSQSTGISLAYGDLWCDTSDLENYPALSRYESVLGVDQWVKLDLTDSNGQNGVVFADMRWSDGGSVDPVRDEMPILAGGLLLSNYVDLDAPSANLYPRGLIGVNTRRSSYNVKRYVANKFNSANYPNQALPMIAGTWESFSGKRYNNIPYFGRKAQRNVIISSIKSAIDSNVEIREDQRYFNLLVCPGYPEVTVNLIALNNDRRNTGFVLADSPMGQSSNSTMLQNYLTNALQEPNDTEDSLVTKDSYTAVFYPGAAITNGIDGSTGQIAVPITHAILRMVVKSDQNSYQWFAPAGTNRGVIDNVVSIGYVDRDMGKFVKVGTNQTLRDLLYTHSVNPVAIFPGVGILNYGNHTRQTDATALDRINVARLVNWIRYQLEIIVKPLIFEPNDKITRNEAKQAVETLLNGLVAKRGLYDYLVVCDETNNTPATIDRNELHIDVAIEPSKAVEFVYIPVKILNTGAIKGTNPSQGGISNPSNVAALA